MTLMQYGISADDLAGVLARQSLDLPAGVARRPRTATSCCASPTSAGRRGSSRISWWPPGESGGEIRLGDIATIRDTFEPEEDKILFNGRRAGILRRGEDEERGHAARATTPCTRSWSARTSCARGASPSR